MVKARSPGSKGTGQHGGVFELGGNDRGHRVRRVRDQRGPTRSSSVAAIVTDASHMPRAQAVTAARTPARFPETDRSPGPRGKGRPGRGRPDRSRPDSGWPGANSRQVADRANGGARQRQPLHAATSVYQRPGPGPVRPPSGRDGLGRHRGTTRSGRAAGRADEAARSWPRSAASRADRGSESAKPTAAALRRARANDGPIDRWPINTTSLGAMRHEGGRAGRTADASTGRYPAAARRAPRVHGMHGRTTEQSLHVNNQPDHGAASRRYVDPVQHRSGSPGNPSFARAQGGKLGVEVGGAVNTT